MPHLFLILTIFAYCLSFVSYLRFLYSGRELAGRIGSGLLSAGLVTHYFALLERSKGLHTVPYHDLYGSMSLFGWLLALTYLVLEFYHRQRSVGAFVVTLHPRVFSGRQFCARGPFVAPAGARRRCSPST